jgi:hypothetical protein
MAFSGLLRGINSFDEWFAKHSFWITLGVALLSTVLLCLGPVTSETVPFGDGQAYARRALQLHGLLHSGRWDGFVKALCTPSTSIFPPSYLIFLLLPTSLAGGATYGLVSCLTWNVLLACGVFGIARVLQLTAMAPAAMLILTANNLALDSVYFFHMDLMFFAWATICLYLQLRAWEAPAFARSFILGASLSGLIFIKPANSAIMLPLFFVAECVQFLYQTISRPDLTRIQLGRWLVRRIVAMAIGLLPGAALSLSFGSFQTVVLLILSNQKSTYFSTILPVNPLIRLLYFPLCLTYFYHLGLLLFIVGIAWGLSRFWIVETSPLRIREYLIPLIVAYLVVWGFFFSFVLDAKVIRSLPFMLTVIVFAVMSVSVFRSAPALLIMGLAAVYFGTMQLQTFVGIFGARGTDPETFALGSDWLWNQPPDKAIARGEPEITRSVVAHIRDAEITTGTVGVGSSDLVLGPSSLNWSAQMDALLSGQEPALQFESLVDAHGQPIREGIEGVKALLLMLDPKMPISRGTYEFNRKVAEYALAYWEPNGAKIFRLGWPESPAAMMLIRFNEPLQGRVLDACMSKIAPAGFSKFFQQAAQLEGTQLGLIESWNLLWRSDERHGSRDIR